MKLNTTMKLNLLAVAMLSVMLTPLYGVDKTIGSSAPAAQTNKDKGDAPSPAADKKAEELIQAIKDKNTERATKLINEGANVNFLNKADANNSPLMYAVVQDDAAVAELLLNKGAELEQKNSRGETALAQSALSSRARMCKLLISRGADVNTTYWDGWTPIVIAARYGNLEIVKMLIDAGADKDYNGGKAIAKTLEFNQLAALKLLLDSGAKPNAGLVNWSIKKGKDYIKLMLDHGAKVNLKDGNGETPLVCAAGGKDKSIVKLLLKHGAKVNLQSKDGTTALMKATQSGNFAIVEMLLKAGANPTIRNDKGETALDLANSDPVKQILSEAFNRRKGKK